MNKADFQRNFSQSFYGLIFNDNTKAHLGRDIGLSKYDLHNGTIIPCYRPVVEPTRQLVNITVKLKGAEEVQSLKVFIPWKEDIDLDKTFMRPGVPSVGMIQGAHTATYVSRIPIRDTPRGHAPRFCRHRIVNPEALMGMSNGTDSLIVWRVFNKLYYSWDAAINMIESGQLVGAAVDRFLALGVVHNKRYIQIFYKDRPPVGCLVGSIPYVYKDYATPSIREYIKKLSGIEPQEK